MDIWLIYLFKTLLLPVSSLLFLSMFAAFYVVKNKGQGRLFLLLPLFFLFVLSLPVVAINLGRLQQYNKPLDYLQLDKKNLQAIVVLGGGRNTYAPEYDLNHTINSHTLLRLRYTAHLIRKLHLPVLVSGGNVFDQSDAPEADLMAAVLSEEFNVPVKWLESKSRNTAENAFFSYKILMKENIKNIILVTHAIHMVRAAEQFERMGFNVTPAPTIFLSMSEISVFSFLPSAFALEMSSMAIHECLGRIWYWIRYKN